MIQEFVLKNLSTLEEVKFGQDLDCDYIYESGGLDWGDIPATHNTYNYPGQIGDSISSSKINNRDITVQAYAYYVLNEDEREEYGRDWVSYAYAKIKEKKEVLNRLINPLDYIRITVGEYYIEGKPEATVQYGTTEDENNIFFCKFMFTIFCANPMFKKLTQTINVLSGDLGAFFFPLAIPPTGYQFGIRDDYLRLEVKNEGNSEIGGRITITAKGTVNKPTVTNQDNGQSFTINKQLVNGEQVIISTIDGPDKGVTGILNGVVSSYLQYWMFNSNDWIKFKPGLSILVYDSQDHSPELIDIKVEINPEKFGLEEM